MTLAVLSLTLGIGANTAVSCGGQGPAIAMPQIDVHLVFDEPEAALAVLRTRMAGRAPADSQWRQLFNSRGYQHLVEREASMGGAFTDSSFRAFLMSDTLLGRFGSLDAAMPMIEHMNVSGAAARALAYLPPGTPFHAQLYLEIKPRTNSFVFTGRDSVPSIFLYVRPNETKAQLENKVAHELHHIGQNAACSELGSSRATPAQRMLLEWLTAFGEGRAMLAAAGSATVHPHAADDDTVRVRWDRDVGHAGADIDTLSDFISAVLDGRVTSADSVEQRGMSYLGGQGPWYTVGWLMAATIERELGHDALVATSCEVTQFISLYNDAAAHANRRGAALPVWSLILVQRLVALRASGHHSQGIVP